MTVRRVRKFGRLAILILFLLVALAPDWPAFQDERPWVRELVSAYEFDYFGWEANALLGKLGAIVDGSHLYVTGEGRRRAVLRYLQDLDTVRRLERSLVEMLADPANGSNGQFADNLRDEIESARSDLTAKQPLFESILQEQVSELLQDEGFGPLVGPFPPVGFTLTQTPLMLIVSPREEISRLYSITLEHGLPIDLRGRLEDEILTSVDRSALIVPIGGLGVYPAMVVENSGINYLSSTVAHEWAHHWLTFRPLGLMYEQDPSLRTINETVASIFGDELGRMVVERFYPELLPPMPDEEPSESAEAAQDPNHFDFNDELGETRIEVERMLARGEVESAERYMEERRQFFWEHGYRIRKLNQAYFAFYGAYADRPGAAGADPIGPLIVQLREESPSLREFMRTMSKVTSVVKLEELASTPAAR